MSVEHAQIETAPNARALRDVSVGLGHADSVPCFEGRLAIRQRVLPDYRAALFDLVAARCSGGLDLLAGEPSQAEGIQCAQDLVVARRARTSNKYLFNGRLTLVWQPDLMSWLKRVAPDALVIEANPRIVDSIRAVRWMHARGRPVIGWGLGTLQLTSGLSSLRRRVRQSYLRVFDGLISYSSLAADQYAAAGFPADRIRVAYNAALPCPERIDVRREPAAGRPMRMLFIGRLIPGKRLEDLFAACARLDVDVRPELWIVGDGPLRSDYEKLAHDSFPARFFGARRGAELAAICRDADIFVLPGKGGLAIQEAMAHGLPVIASSADGTERDLVRPGNGRLVAEGDIDALRGAIQELVRAPQLIGEMGAESLRIVREEINLERMAAQFVTAVRELSQPRQHI